MSKSIKKVDVFVIGAGVAGMTAALYASRMKLNTLVIEDALIGGQIRNAHIVENYPGFSSISGSDLVENIKQQALTFGAAIDEFDQIVKVDLSASKKRIETETAIYEAKAVIIASGTKRRELPVGEKKFAGNGIHYCELCDGPWYEGKTIAVIGGGNSAVGAVDILKKYAKKIYLIHRSPKLTAEPIQQEKVRSYTDVEILLNTIITKINGTDKVEEVILEDKQTLQQRGLKVDGIFVNIGSTPQTALFKDILNLSESGHIVAGESCETNIPGVFAAGDVRTKLFRQLTTAVGDGTTAALMAEKYILAYK